MPAATTEFVDVTVSLTGAAADKFAFGSLMGMFDHAVSVNRQEGPFFDLAAVVAAGFTSVAEAEVNAWATAVFSQQNGVDSIIVGHTDGIESITDAITAIVADDPTSFYIINQESRVEADINEMATVVEALEKIYIAQSNDAAVLAGTAGNIAEDLQGFNYNRTAYIWHATNSGTDGYLDGAWSSFAGGFNLDGPAGVGSWAFNQLSGVTFDSVTAAEAVNVFGFDANLFGRNKGLNFTAKGTMASGRFIDVQTSLDWLKARLEEELVAAIVGAPTKIPFTNAGINILAAAIQVVYDKGIAFGHLSPDEPPTLTAPRVTEVSTADKAARQYTMTGNAVLAGAIHKVVFTINVQQ